LRIRTGSDSILSDQDWTRTEKFHSPLISANLATLFPRVEHSHKIPKIANKFPTFFTNHCLWKEILSQQRIRHFKIVQSMYFVYDVGVSSYSNFSSVPIKIFHKSVHY